MRVGLVELSERHDKRTNGNQQHYRPQQTADRKCYEEVANFLVTSRQHVSDLLLEEVSDLSGMSLTCYEVVGDTLATSFGLVTRN